MVNRRELLIAGTGTAIAWPRATRAQQKAMPVIGYLGGTTPGTNASFVAAFRRGLNETGDVEGQNVAIEYSCAEGHYDRRPALAADPCRPQSQRDCSKRHSLTTNSLSVSIARPGPIRPSHEPGWLPFARLRPAK